VIDKRFFNTLFVISPQGEIVTRRRRTTSGAASVLR
jgi:hypothetical protein